MRDEYRPGWKECGNVAPPPHPPWGQRVPREENPRMVLSQYFGINPHLLSMNSGKSGNIPCLVVLHFLKVQKLL